MKTTARRGGAAWVLPSPIYPPPLHPSNICPPPPSLPTQAASMRIFGAEPLTVFKSNKDDPYITLPDSDDESEKEDDVIRETGAFAFDCRP